jgi:hypothetical protein
MCLVLDPMGTRWRRRIPLLPKSCTVNLKTPAGKARRCGIVGRLADLQPPHLVIILRQECLYPRDVL